MMQQVKEKINAAQMDIAGVLFQPLKIIDTPGGAVLHGMRAEFPLMPDFGSGFGELYFSEVLPGAIKAWKMHERQTQLFMVPAGIIKLVLFDNRPASATKGKLLVTSLGRPDNYGLLKIPPNIWYGFQCMGVEPALICNLADLPHDPAETVKLSLDNDLIPYKWNGD